MKLSFEDLQTFATHDRAPFFRIAAHYVDRDAPTLDIGAGNGTFAEIIGDPNIHLIEGNPETARLLRVRYPNVHELTLPAELPFPSDHFGLIHSSHLIEHLLPADLYRLLQEMHRCLAPGGHLAISTPLLWDGFFDDLSHIKPYPPAVLMKYLCESESGTRGELTRSTVSHGYVLRRLVYRYRPKEPPLLSLGYSSRWARRFAFQISRLMHTASLTTFEKTGYTIVLQKPSSAPRTLTGDSSSA